MKYSAIPIRLNTMTVANTIAGLEVAVELEQHVTEPPVGGDELGHDRGGRGQRRADLEAGEDARQRVRQADLAEHRDCPAPVERARSRMSGAPT